MEITLTQGKTAIVDYDDWEALKLFKWFAQKCKSNRYYARRNIKIGDGKQKHINMHHEKLKGEQNGRKEYRETSWGGTKK
jgi:hypothetical protein